MVIQARLERRQELLTKLTPEPPMVRVLLPAINLAVAYPQSLIWLFVLLIHRRAKAA